MKPTLVKLLGIHAGSGAGTPGAEDGPFVLRQRGLVDVLERRGHRVEDLGDIPGVYETRFASVAGTSVNNLANILQVNRHIHACVLGTLRSAPDAFLLAIGGDHSLAMGTLAGLSDACQRLGLIWIDAHADFNTPETSPSGNLHGMSLAVSCGRGISDLRQIAAREPVIREEDVFLFGVRDVDPGERKLLRASKVTMISAGEWRRTGVLRAIERAYQTLATRCDHIHVSFDVDVLDPPVAPATGTPVPGGLTADQALKVAYLLSSFDRIRSAEFVEYNPKLDTSSATGALVLDLVASLLATPAAESGARAG